MRKESTLESLWAIVEPLAQQVGLELVDIEYHREGQGRVLRVYLDKSHPRDETVAGEGPDLNDLARVSRELSDLLDVHDIPQGPYTLEVSSPGINRSLRKPEHFARYVGKRVRVASRLMIEGRRRFQGLLRQVTDGGVVVLQDDREVFIPFSEIVKANYEHHWEEPKRQRGKKAGRSEDPNRRTYAARSQ